MPRSLPLLPPLLSLAVLLNACAPLAARFSSRHVPSLRGARSVEIEYEWRSWANGVAVRHQLERQGATDTFAGSGTMLIHGSSGPLAVTIPDTAMVAFLEALSRVPITTGEYEPVWQPDSYPRYTVRVHLDDGVVEFHSSSATSDMRPWRVDLAGTKYVSRSGATMEALKHLYPFMRHEELMRERAERPPTPAAGGTAP